MTLLKGNRIRFLVAPDTPGPDIWLVTQTSEGGATIERELVTPRLVEIKDDDGTVTRSFYARTSGDRQQISINSHVHIIPNEMTNEQEQEQDHDTETV